MIANPPFSLEKSGEEVWTSDPFGRNFAGMPPGKSGDYAWVQHMIKRLAPKTGRMPTFNYCLPTKLPRATNEGHATYFLKNIARVV